VFHSPGVVSGFDNFAVMSDAVEHGGGHLFVAEDLGPFPEGEIGGDDYRGLLVEFGDQVKEQLAGVFRKRQIAQLIEHHQVEARQAGGEPASATGQILLLQVVGEIDQVVEGTVGTVFF
jgi:hypothetical protein